MFEDIEKIRYDINCSFYLSAPYYNVNTNIPLFHNKCMLIFDIDLYSGVSLIRNPFRYEQLELAINVHTIVRTYSTHLFNMNEISDKFSNKWSSNA